MIPTQPFGRTGHASSRLIFGSWALSEASSKEASQTLELLLQHGINHLDTAPMYGKAEKLIGEWMKTHRKDFFLATKTRKRTYQEAWDGLQKSLERLNTDHVDLWQMHGLTNPNGWERAMGEGGALQALLEAREKGMVRFLGVTGHGSHTAEMHLQSLGRFDFDSVMLPYNYPQMGQPKYAASFNQLAGLCQERRVALQLIKSLAWRPWGKRPRTGHTWFYEPVSSPEAIELCLHWALGLPGSFVVSTGDLSLLPAILQAGERFTGRPTDEAMRALAVEIGMQAVWK
jgi:aryl-alcohol dehydrogenase-like predicted oxidoreductase